MLDIYLYINVKNSLLLISIGLIFLKIFSSMVRHVSKGGLLLGKWFIKNIKEDHEMDVIM